MIHLVMRETESKSRKRKKVVGQDSSGRSSAASIGSKSRMFALLTPTMRVTQKMRASDSGRTK